MKFLREQTKNMSSYPRLQEEIERIIANKIMDQEGSAKDYINYLIETELAYMNTNHTDFIVSYIKNDIFSHWKK